MGVSSVLDSSGLLSYARKRIVFVADEVVDVQEVLVRQLEFYREGSKLVPRKIVQIYVTKKGDQAEHTPHESARRRLVSC
jgi:hypothetical protein